MRQWMQDMGQRLAGPVAVGLILGLIGPFGTYASLPLFPRLGYWLAIVAINWLLCDLAIRRVDALAPASLPLRRAAVPLIGAALISLPATGVVATANGLSYIGWPESVVVIFGQVAVLLAAIALPVYSLADLRETAHSVEDIPRSASATDTNADNAGLELFQARLRDPLDGQLLCLEMQDHYLAVHTTKGSELILCRMEDAARELDGLGRRVHKSWWAAEDAVAGIERDGQRLLLRLTDNRRVPVGRTYRHGLKSDGWL
jgi:hypothetical protein